MRVFNNWLDLIPNKTFWLYNETLMILMKWAINEKLIASFVRENSNEWMFFSYDEYK